jgi:hypothetical protein
MNLTKLALILGLTLLTTAGAIMLAPRPAEATSMKRDFCPANHLRCFNGACTVAAPLWNCDADPLGGNCTETFWGSDPACQT